MSTNRKIIDYFLLAYRRVKKLLRISEKIKEVEWSRKYESLVEKIFQTKESGISSEKISDNEIIVSLTTYGKRFYDVAVTIESIMQGSVKPNRIILWLAEDMKKIKIPIALKKQIDRGLEIEYCKDLLSYKKLIPCLKKYPQANIITIDDDIIYPFDLIENLINTHEIFPKKIIANRIHRVVLKKNGNPTSYKKWEHDITPNDDSPLNFFTSGGGTLFPPNSLSNEVLNEDVFLDICKFADDVWFYAMALKNGTKTIKTTTRTTRLGLNYIDNPLVQDTALWQENFNLDTATYRNDDQFKAVFEKYDLYKKLKQ